MSASHGVWPTPCYDAAVNFVEVMAAQATVEDGEARLAFEELHPATQVAMLDGLLGMAKVIATATRAS